MQKLSCIACALFILIGCDSSKKIMRNSNVLSIDQINEGWELLFDGKTTKGWHQYGNEPAGSAWKVNDGELYFDNTIKEDGNSDIVTDEEFGNFHLKLEWKISKNGNSGIMFYVHEDKEKYKWTYETGPEMQVLDNDGHRDGKIQKHRSGDLYDLVACSRETVKAVGEWNQVEIKCLNGKLDFYLNGENVVSTTMWDENWKKMVAGSKFRSMPGFSIYKTGRIALQDHGDLVWFRNIMIRRL